MKMVPLEMPRSIAVSAEAQQDRLIVTRSGHTRCAGHGRDGMNEEQIRLSSDPEFWKLIEERRRQRPSAARSSTGGWLKMSLLSSTSRIDTSNACGRWGDHSSTDMATARWPRSSLLSAQDSVGVAGRIYDRLRAHFGNDAVFMDIDSIPFGDRLPGTHRRGCRPVRRGPRRDRNEVGRGDRRSSTARRPERLCPDRA